MPKKKEFDSEQLIKMIQSGVEQKEIMDKFSFNNSTQLKVAYANALMETGKAPEIQTGTKAEAKPNKDIKVNKRGSLVVPKNLIEEFQFSEGDNFQVRKTKAGISLKKI